MRNLGEWASSEDAELADRIRTLREEFKQDSIADQKKRIAAKPIRTTSLAPFDQDPHAFERLFGESDLVSINYLELGVKAAQSVCRVRVPAPGQEWFGTGFLVGPGLLITNHHVIGSANEAAQAIAEFSYEFDGDGVRRSTASFGLTPHDVFITDPELDVTLVSVNPLSADGVPLDRFRYLPLIPISGKGIHGEWVTLIQHPDGAPKQIALRKSQLMEVDVRRFGEIARNFIHYTTDTLPGSSGAPVLNDQWQVVALHHRGVLSQESIERIRAGELKIGANCRTT